MVDYYSRYIEIAKLPQKDASSMEVIRHLKSIMARHGIPAEIVSDNRPQFSAAVFAEFTKSYGITHQTSSPRHPQGNGEAERAVKTVKSILNKSEIFRLTGLSYNSHTQWVQPVTTPHGKDTEINNSAASNSFCPTAAKSD